MGLLDIFRRHKKTEKRVGGMEDFMTLIRVYYQAALAANLGISNLAMLPDLRTFKQTLHVQTVNNRLGQGEKAKCKKMLSEMYGLKESFFKEIDASIKANCRTLQHLQPYFIRFQGFSQDLLTHVTSEQQWKLRLPRLFKGTLRQVVAQSVHGIFSKPFYKDAALQKSAVGIRKYNQQLGYSPEWMTEYVYQVVLLAKKEPRNKVADNA
ncbi:MAG: hypothetical protein Q4A44_04580 [Bacteroidales bacterium]|nr:hypothetical protein [Bacteroidales bacterium]